MTQKEVEQLERLIGTMDDGEKRLLIAKLNRSMNSGQGEAAGPDRLPNDEWKRKLDAWVSGHAQNPSVDDSRGSIYAGRG
jgi:hypothetical protein